MRIQQVLNQYQTNEGSREASSQAHTLHLHTDRKGVGSQERVAGDPEQGPPHARAPREANLTPGAARGCQAGLRPHWTHPAPAKMKDLTSHPI